MRNIKSHLGLFDFGVRLYAIGQYDAAIERLLKFVTRYPSREVFNNLGMCYYQKVFTHYAAWKRKAIDRTKKRLLAFLRRECRDLQDAISDR